MIEPCAASTADDLSVSCRVRRSETASDPEFDEYVDMTCTLRNWARHGRKYNIVKVNSDSSDPTNAKRDRYSSLHEGPELVLSPSITTDKYPMVIQDRARSSGSAGEQRSSSGPRSRSNSASRRRIWNEMCVDDARQQEEEKPPPQPFAIPVYDIVVVDSMGCNSPIFLTTQSAGYYEFSFNTSNAHDVFLAFLTNSLPYERIICACSTPLDVCSESFDVETLTATRMQRRVEAETMTEKVMRKLNLVADRIGELSTAFSECACNCDYAKPTPRDGDDSVRQGAPRHFEFPTELEVEVPSPTTVRQPNPW